ncbi:CHAD domain-containing protein [Candidatus Spongiihabitans sp.]|uniref:CHAD domain-containing protein n=1 Tax=Candidatus Spongiihabitans sp. TaxID=3101308 RepID=UPI003C7E4257
MNCLEKYRSKLIREINKDLRVILAKFEPGPERGHERGPEQELEQDAVHNFRVGVKRLTALYCFLNEINVDLNAKKILKPYRSLFKSIGNIRDGHIAVHLVQNLAEVNSEESKILVRAIRARIRKDYRLFQKQVQSNAPLKTNALLKTRASIRMPTISSTGISARAILRYKRIVLDDLLVQILRTEGPMSAAQWHKKRILLKRYHHTLDAFRFCPGHKSDEDTLKQIKMLEQLLGDWHDRVITISLLQSFQGLEAQTAPTIAIMKKQHRLLLGSAKIYLSDLRLKVVATP